MEKLTLLIPNHTKKFVIPTSVLRLQPPVLLNQLTSWHSIVYAHTYHTRLSSSITHSFLRMKTPLRWFKCHTQIDKESAFTSEVGWEVFFNSGHFRGGQEISKESPVAVTKLLANSIKINNYSEAWLEHTVSLMERRLKHCLKSISWILHTHTL